MKQFLRTRQRTRLHSRKGFALLGDLGWILGFAIIVIILFFFLYKPLITKNIDTKITSTISPVRNYPYSDAQYLALSLANRIPELGLNKETATFSAVVRDIIEQRQDAFTADEFDDVVYHSGYEATLNKVFEPISPFWTTSEYSVIDGTTITERTRVMVIVHHQNEWLTRTCKEYTRAGTSSSLHCQWFEPNQPSADIGQRQLERSREETNQAIDPDTGILVPVSRAMEYGSVYIPTSNGPATLYVFVIRGERK